MESFENAIENLTCTTMEYIDRMVDIDDLSVFAFIINCHLNSIAHVIYLFEKVYRKREPSPLSEKLKDRLSKFAQELQKEFVDVEPPK